MLENIIPNHYLRALVISAVLMMVLRTAFSIIERITLKLTKKTTTDLDDIIIKKASKPATFLLTIISLAAGVGEIPLSDSVNAISNKTIYTFLLLSISYLLYSVSDIIITYSWGRISGRSGQKKVMESLSSFILGSIQLTLIAITLLYSLHIWGIEITPILAGLGIAGLAVALALQPTLSNIFSGISVILDKTVRVGDLVYLDRETKGKIKSIGLRSTKIITFDNELIIVPNGEIASSRIQNVALPEAKTRAVVPFGVAYGNDIERVKKIVLAEIKKIKNYLPDPEPAVRFIEMGASSLNFKAYFYVDTFENRFGAIDEANTRIYNILNKNKIEIPYPQMDLHLKEDKKSKKKTNKNLNTLKRDS